jgi:predicted nucleic acid-binding Zn ribbon protein
MTSPHAIAPPPSDAEPRHGCVRCGARIPVSEAMCESCNPLGLRQPAASQAHGTVFLGVAVAVIVLAVIARTAVAGVGPFRTEVGDVDRADGGLRVTIALTNEGSAAGQTTCRVSDPTIPGIGPETAYVQSPTVQPGATITFDAVVSSLGTEPRPLDVACRR